MKKIFTYIIGAAAVLTAISSCDLILDQKSPSTFDGETMFSNYTLAESAVFGVTETFCEVNSYRGRFLPWYGFNTDIEWYNTYKPGDNKSDIAGYDVKTNNSQLNVNNNPYVLMFTGIERANLVIEGLREYGNVSEDKDMAYLLAETLTLRAMIYHDLVKAWGDVPARFESVNASTIYVRKASRDEIYKQILADLDEAIPMLPYPGKSAATSRNDRINKVFAEGLYARIALAASGYALRPDDGKVGTGNAGSIRLSSDAALSKEALYPKALAYLKDAIGNGGCSLSQDYEQYWRRQSNLDNVKYDGETLYIIPFGDGRGRWNFTFAVHSESSSYSSSVSRGGDAGPVPTFFFEYDPNDVRRDVTCVNYMWNKFDKPEMAGISKWYFGKYRFEWMDNVPYGGGNDDGVKPVVMRYSDVLLMAAEIANELGDLPAAKQYMLPVRTRAFKGHEAQAQEYVNAISSKDAMFKAIVDERALEFCGEFLRKADLIRWNMLKSSMDETKAKLYDLRDKVGDYSFLSGNVYYRLGVDGKSVEVYGLAKGQTEVKDDTWDVETDYIKYDDGKKTGLYSLRIDGIYYVDPEAFMYWPIFDEQLTSSQGYLVNDYGYAI